MNFESSIENKIEYGKETLMSLEKEGNYVFHGSTEILEELEPRQARTLDDKERMIDHGKPSVATTPFAEIAIFRAIINKNIKDDNGKYSSSFGTTDGKPYFETTPGVFKNAKDAVGYVYVFKKDDFTKINEMEWRSDKSLKPIRIFEVRFQDLPENIKVEPRA